MKKIKVLSCIATIAVMALIFFFSSQTAAVSSKTSSGITRKIAELVATIMQTDDVKSIQAVLHTIVRKAAHFMLFFVLALSVANTVFQLFGTEKGKLFIITCVFCLFYAITDEVHQIFVPGRAAMLIDVFIDLAGSISGGGIFILLRYLYKRRKKYVL
ncbi:MAG: VanZ family protein [Clostridia bacterium]|nr:VanZ family protein [Clostridia bacterium]